jgi:hypothetical protein
VTVALPTQQVGAHRVQRDEDDIRRGQFSDSLGTRRGHGADGPCSGYI